MLAILGADLQTEQGPRPSFTAEPVGPGRDQGGAATIPNTNVKVDTPPPDAASAFDEKHGSAMKVINHSGSSVSLEEEDGIHKQEAR